LTPNLNRAELRTSFSATKDGEGSARIAIVKRSTGPQDEEDPHTSWYRYAVDMDESSTLEVSSKKPRAKLVGANPSYFIPVWVLVQFDAAEAKIRDTVDVIFQQSALLASSFRSEYDVVSGAALEIINNWLIAHDAETIPIATLGAAWSRVSESLSPFISRAAAELNPLISRRGLSDSKLAGELNLLKTQLLQEMLRTFNSEYEVALEYPRAIDAASDFIKDFFREGIRYLGPLRDVPKPMYQLEALESTTNVGYRGEHTAAILDLNGDRQIFYHSPPTDASGAEYATLSERHRGSLHDAVVQWLAYLGIADEVITTEAGVSGHRLQVSMDKSGQLHDLTNVGVGVSQVLPIVVTALLAPPGSFLIFEQPELHLHPRVQARLADFFIALALDGKQTLLETHSEYLVDRIRLRIALAEEDTVRPLVNILFSEKVGGESKLRPIEVSEFGSIANWPRDFFDQSQRDVGRIVQAASEKRRRGHR
jgi:predicted ATPase